MDTVKEHNKSHSILATNQRTEGEERVLSRTARTPMQHEASDDLKRSDSGESVRGRDAQSR